MARDRRFSIEKLNRLVSNKGAMPTRKRIGIAPATAFDCTPGEGVSVFNRSFSGRRSQLTMHDNAVLSVSAD